MKLIDRESLIEHMRKAYKGNTENGFKWDLESTVAVIGIEEEMTLPTAQPKAHWSKGFKGEEDIYVCSNCGWGYYDAEDYHYCPTCGCYMGEIEE